MGEGNQEEDFSKTGERLHCCEQCRDGEMRTEQKEGEIPGAGAPF